MPGVAGVPVPGVAGVHIVPLPGVAGVHIGVLCFCFCLADLQSRVLQQRMLENPVQEMSGRMAKLAVTLAGSQRPVAKANQKKAGQTSRHETSQQTSKRKR